MSRRRYLFVDRDGTLIEEPADQQVDRIDKIRLVDGVMPALLALQSSGYELVMVSNQDGRGTESFPEEDFSAPHLFMRSLFETQGVAFADERICPHLPDAGCDCRKPATGLLADYLARDDWSRGDSAVIGDRDSDLQLARNLGVRGFQIGPLRWHEIVAALTRGPRSATAERATSETRIRATVDLDQPDPVAIDTGIGFFDHMLEQLARHGGFALELECAGDLHIDDHHSVEDCALTLGEALASAVGDKRGIGRYGFVLPMDESRCEATVDLSGRAYCAFEAPFRRERVGELATEMVGHFFSSLAQAMRLTLHVRVTGDNDHHIAEAAFKGVGRALRQAFERRDDRLPSTKGVL